MSVLVKNVGASVEIAEAPRSFFRGTNEITGLTAGHKYLVILSTLNATGSARDVNGSSLGYSGFTDVEKAVRFGDGSGANAGQRCEGGFFVGRATGTTATVGTSWTWTQAMAVFDLG